MGGWKQIMSEQAANVGSVFVWHEVNVPDAGKAKDFYTEIFGWGTEDMPMGDMGTYTMFTKNGMPVGGIMATVGDMAHVPPHWSTYIACDDVDAKAARVVELGGNLMVPAFDVEGIGRMALVADPQGAVFWLYKGASE